MEPSKVTGELTEGDVVNRDNNGSVLEHFEAKNTGVGTEEID